MEVMSKANPPFPTLLSEDKGRLLPWPPQWAEEHESQAEGVGKELGEDILSVAF